MQTYGLTDFGTASPDKLKPIMYNTFKTNMGDELVTGNKIPLRAPNCLKCAFFRVTWDTNFPRSCEIFSIKCNSLPSFEVYHATGANCPSFKLKEGLKD